MRKILDQKFWSHGTSLGHLGPGSQKGLDEMFSKLCFPIAIGPNESPDMLVPFPHAENLKKFPDRRGNRNQNFRTEKGLSKSQPKVSK